MQDITCGSATVVATETGWVLPGGRIIRNKQQARMYVIRMNRIMERGDA